MTEEHESPLHALGKGVTAPPAGVAPYAAARQSSSARRPPVRSLLLLFARLLRPSLTVALALPVVWGMAQARWRQVDIDVWSMGLLLIANGAFCIGLNLAGQYVDFRRLLRTDRTKLDRKQSRASASTGHDKNPAQDVFHLLQSRIVRPGTVRSLVLLALSLCALAYLWLGLLAGWPLWFFGALGLLLAAVSILPAVRYSQRLWIVGDLTLLLAVGVLPALSAYYTQIPAIDRWIVAGSMAPALLVWLTLLSYNLLTWRRDWKIQRGTAVAALGPEHALDGAAVLSVAAFTSVLLLMALGALPFSSLLVLGALPIFLHAFTRNSQQPVTQADALYIIDRSTQATILTALLWMLALWNG